MSDIEKVKKLREATGAGFKDCNLAIKESGGDLDKAVEILRVKGISKASKKMSRDAKEGVVAISGDEKKTSIIEVNCETDFVAKNDDFINFVKELSEINNQSSSNLEKLKKTSLKKYTRKIASVKFSKVLSFSDFSASIKQLMKKTDTLRALFRFRVLKEILKKNPSFFRCAEPLSFQQVVQGIACWGFPLV